MKRSIGLLMVLVILLSVGCASNNETEKMKDVVEEASSNSDVNESNAENVNTAQNERKKLTLYTYNVDEAEATNNYAIDKIEEEYQVEIEIIHRSDSTGEELKTKAAIGELPDIFELKAANVLESFIKSGDVAPLDNSLEKYGVFEYVDAKIIDGIRNSDGNLYVYELIEPRNYLLYYNKSVFDQYNVPLPTNYDEFLEAVKTFDENGVIPLALFGSEIWPGFQFYDYLASRENPGGWKDIVEGKANITDTAYADAAKKLVELVDAGLISKAAFATNASQAFEYFKTGKAAMVGNGTWYFSQIGQYESELGTEFGYLDNPLSVPGQEEATLYNRSGSTPEGGYTVSAKGDNVELATEIMHKFVKYKAEANVKLYGAVNPMKYEIALEVEKPNVVKKYEQEIPKFETGTMLYGAIKSPEVKTGIGDATQALWAGSITVEEFLQQIDELIKANPTQ